VSNLLKSTKMNLKSSINEKGKKVTQILTFKGGYKKTIRGILSDSVMQSEFTHMETDDGRLILINTPNILMVEVFSEPTTCPPDDVIGM
jgi:hypothetical protein